MKQRLDVVLNLRKLVRSRSQAESYVKLGKVLVNGKKATKSGLLVGDKDVISVEVETQYVSRAALKLESIASKFELDFRGKIVLDVGSSTGGFTQYALMRGAKKVVAVELGTGQMDLSLRLDPRVELYEKTDIRNVTRSTKEKTVWDPGVAIITDKIDIVLVDVSFVSVRDLLPSIFKLIDKTTIIIVMLKPQFEASNDGLKHKGVVKNDKMRRDIIKSFEIWSRNYLMINGKSDSGVAGQDGNVERFYKLQQLR